MQQQWRRWLVAGVVAAGSVWADAGVANAAPVSPARVLIDCPVEQLAQPQAGVAARQVATEMLPAPCDPPPPPPPPTSPYYNGPTYTDARSKVVTLGDSYSSGTGIWKEDSSYDEQFGGYQNYGLNLTGRSDDECWREIHDTPGPLRAAATNARSIFLACKGAEVTHVNDQITTMQGQWPTDAAAKWANSLILLTAGGNDIRTNDGQDWPSLLERCITEFNPFGGCHDKSKNQIANWSTVQTRLQNMYTSLASKASGAKIRIMGYPLLMTPRSSGLSQCPDVTGVTGNEARWIYQQVVTLNSKIAAAVAAAKSAYPAVDIKFVSVTSYLTVGACFGQGSSAHINDRVVAWSGSGILLTSDASFHPKRLGYQRYYDALVASL